MTSLHDQTFKKIVPTDFKDHTFSQCQFESCDLTQRDFTRSKLIDCAFKGCNLSLVKLQGCRLQNVVFENCKLVGVNFGQCDPMFLKMIFKECLIGTCNFSDLDMKGTVFTGCMIRETHFTATNLSGAQFSGSDLRGSVFHNSNLSKANFVGAINYSINPLTNSLKQARFSQPEVLALLQHLEIILE